MDATLYSHIFAIEDHYWWSVGTRAIFAEWLASSLPRGPVTILDVGCGSGRFMQELSRRGVVHGMDIAPEAIDLSRRRGIERLCVGTAEHLPYRTGSFDAVSAADVVEHVDDRVALTEIVRVLRPGGVALIHVPAFPMLWGPHDVAAHHRRRYRRAEFCRVVAASGLHITRLSYVNCLVFPVAVAVRGGRRLLPGPRHVGPAAADIYDLPRWLNTMLTRMLLLERMAMRRISLPFGVSLLCVARKT